MAEATISSATAVKTEQVRSRIRLKLNEEKIKLWLPPYTTSDGQRGEVAQSLIDKYSNELNLSRDEVLTYFEELRCHALEKLATKKLFDEKGVATLKCKLAGNIPKNVQERKFTFEMSLFVTGYDLKTTIAKKCCISCDRLKIISSGHVIDDVTPLNQQSVRNNSQLMVIYVSVNEAQARLQEQQACKLAQTREAAELLASREDGGNDDRENYYLQIADQTGKPINMPKEERKALVLAMTLHEKGKAVLKKKEYGDSLLLLLEADKEFKKCRSDILSCVDNYALLCLDIVWCYLCLQNINDLPDAEARLKACDDCFRKSYGPNLERLALVKGGTGTEKALFMRLHLLQGILAFHQHRKTEARALLERAERELKLLTVDESSMLQVMQMGFTQQEARLGLRMTEGNMQLAVAHIMKRKEEKKEVEAKVKAEKRQKRLQTKFGKAGNGQDVNIEHYDNLVAMGYAKGAAAEALKQANNDIIAALQVLTDNPNLLNLPDPEPQKCPLSPEMIAQVRAMGFDEESAKAALHQFHDVRKAIEELLRVGGVAPPTWLDAVLQSAPGTSSGSGGAPQKSAAEMARERELMDSIIQDLPQDEEQHLDLTLEDESTLLHQYITYIVSLDT